MYLSDPIDFPSLDGLSKNETVKATSNHLRGLIKEELIEDTPAFGDDSETLLKFHGIYQQDDRDRRKEARAKGLDKHHQLMIRTRIPGGVVSADAYIAHDDIRLHMRVSQRLRNPHPPKCGLPRRGNRPDNLVRTIHLRGHKFVLLTRALLMCMVRGSALTTSARALSLSR